MINNNTTSSITTTAAPPPTAVNLLDSLSIPLTLPSRITAPSCSPKTRYNNSPINSLVSPKEGASAANTCCGWLWMRSSKLSRWKYRYFSFELENATLTYYDKFPTEEYFKSNIASFQDTLHSEGTSPRGVLRVAHVEPIKKNNLGFKVYGNCGKLIDLRCAKASIRNVWLASLTPAMERQSRAWKSSVSSYGNSPQALSPVASPRDEIQLAGWILKQSDHLKQWRKYYMVLQGEMLSYYVDDKSYTVPRRRGYVTSVAEGKNGRLIIGLNTGPALHVTVTDTNGGPTASMWLQGIIACLEDQRQRHLANDDELMSNLTTQQYSVDYDDSSDDADTAAYSENEV